METLLIVVPEVDDATMYLASNKFFNLIDLKDFEGETDIPLEDMLKNEVKVFMEEQKELCSLVDIEVKNIDDLSNKMFTYVYAYWNNDFDWHDLLELILEFSIPSYKVSNRDLLEFAKDKGVLATNTVILPREY